MDKLKNKIKSINKDIEYLTSKFCLGKFSVVNYGAFHIDFEYLFIGFVFNPIRLNLNWKKMCYSGMNCKKFYIKTTILLLKENK